MTYEGSSEPRAAGKFLFLGPLDAYVGEERLRLGSVQEKRLLVALVSEAGHPVPRDSLLEWVWDDVPEIGTPTEKGIHSAFHKLVWSLRTRLGRAGYDNAIAGERGTYRLDLPATAVDINQFTRLRDRARELAGSGQGESAAAQLSDALRLYRGEPLAGLPGRPLEAYRVRLQEERHQARLSFIQLSIQTGEHMARIPDLAGLHRERPEDEMVIWLYMHALYRSGRQHDAQNLFHETNGRLAQSIAGEAMAALRNLNERMITDDQSLFEPRAVELPGGRPLLHVAGRGEGNADRSQGPDTTDAADDSSEAAGGADSRRDGASRESQGSQTVTTHITDAKFYGATFGIVNYGQR